MHKSDLIAQASQVARRRPALDLFCHAFPAADTTPDYALRMAGRDSFPVHMPGGLHAGLTELYYSAALTLLLKVIVLPWILHRLIQTPRRAMGQRAAGEYSHTMLVGLVLVIFAFGLAQPISELATTITRHTSASHSPSSCSLSDDDYAAQSDDAGDWISGHGKWTLLCRNQRDLWHAHGH